MAIRKSKRKYSPEKKGAVIRTNSRPFVAEKKRSYIPYLRKVIALLLILEGIILLGQTIFLHGPSVGKFLRAEVESVVANVKKEPNNRFGTITVSKEALLQSRKAVHPKRILIPKIGLEQPIEDGKFTNGQWDISEDGVSFMVGSCTPGNPCNIVIYGHAKEAIFGPLKKIKLNDMITILTDKNWYSYRVTDIFEVVPDQISVIGPTKDETLTLFTCSAFLDSKRLVVIAKRA